MVVRTGSGSRPEKVVTIWSPGVTSTSTVGEPASWRSLAAWRPDTPTTWPSAYGSPSSAARSADAAAVAPTTCPFRAGNPGAGSGVPSAAEMPARLGHVTRRAKAPSSPSAGWSTAGRKATSHSGASSSSSASSASSPRTTSAGASSSRPR